MMLTRRLATLAALALLAFALPLASAQHGPPPGYTDPAVYAQDYAAGQAAQAQADPVGYATGKATPENVSAEAEHAAWLACWTAYEAGQMALDPVCAQFFIAPGVVDAPAEAEAEITATLNATGADALLGETTDALADTLGDPTSAVAQVKRILEAVGDFVGGIVEFVLDLVGFGRQTAVAGIGALADGLLVLLGLPALGVQTAVDGLLIAGTSAVDGLAAAGTGLAAAMVAVADGLVAAAVAVGTGIATGGQGLADGVAFLGGAVAGAATATTGAVGDAADAVLDTVADAAKAVTDTVGGWFGGEPASGDSGRDLVGDGGLETGTEADGLVDRIFGLL